MIAQASAPQNNLRVDPNQIAKQLELLAYKPGEKVFLRAFYPSDDPRKGDDKGRKADAIAVDLIAQTAEKFQNEGRGIYLVVNGGGQTDAEVETCRAIFYEHDNLSKDLQLSLWQSKGLPEPTFQVDTGGKSIHSYWVLTEPIDPTRWRSLQSDLLEFASGDRSLKNPSRVMRLAGCYHLSSKGVNPSLIVSESGTRYSFEDLRGIVPTQQKTPSPSLPLSKSIGDVPLIECIPKADRELVIGGAGEGERNTLGAKLARSLIGAELRLAHLGISHTETARELFNNYRFHCNPSLEDKEAEQIWKSAIASNPTATLTDDAILNCVKAWQRKQLNVNEKSSVTGDYSKPKKLSLRDASEKAREILKAQQDELESNLKLEEIRAACGMGSGDWEQKIIKPLKRELEADRFKLDLIYVLAIDDQVERIRQQALLAPRYQMSAAMLAQAIAAMKQRTFTPEVKVYDLDELFDLESKGIDWVIPELLPRGESIILAASPKAGKTLLAIDAAFAIATGESDFLGEKTKRGKVLLISVDESLNSTKNKLLKRGFRRQDKEYIRVLPLWTIDQMGVLEAQLEDFRPDVVIVDSLRRINHGSPISENSAEFADNIYTLKETIGRYGASGILIHHNNKNADALGVGRIRGSSAIAGAVWGTWQLDHIPKQDPNNKKKLIIDPKDPKRVLSVFARDAEGQTFNIEFDPENNSWIKLGGDTPEAQEEKTLKDRILHILGINQSGLSGREIIELLGMTKEEGRGIYTTLNRMVSKRIISCKPAPGDKRYNIYTLPTKTLPPPSPIDSDPNVEYSSESLYQQGLDNTQHNTQHLEKITQHLNEVISPAECLNLDTVGNVAILNTSTENIGGGGDFPSVEHSETESDSVISDTSDSKSAVTPQDEVATLQPTITVSKAIAVKAGQKVEFFCESDREWQRGVVKSVKFDSGYFVEAIIEYWAFGKMRHQTTYNERYLRNFC